MNLAFVDNDTDAPEYDWQELDIEPLEYRPTAVFRPKITVIPLPSNISLAWCNELSVTDLVAQEITLREGQANDLLHLLWVHLADKAVLFRTTVHPAKLQAQSTRAWAQVHSVEQILAGWQIGALDDNKLYDAFENFNCMWKDHFDLGPFEMPNRIPLLEVKELVEEHFEQLHVGHLLIPELPQMPTSHDPLLQQVRCIRENMQQLGEGLQSMLLTKVEEGDLAVDALTRLEGLVDEVMDIMQASHELIDTLGIKQE
ncbi:uncharacterized protein F5891DRAFT_1191175 [Suillus fuscotomentosus]|uniref:Uncharacterized protein n=1 Tax=Suillus fuscotomentosus TaxID=1912939 RepID=A0AAD4E464_9AGAM|nr:uncharacterized protein F5891DRAFT_1191175 [Suillus fuscotomentosus]KAG1898189.1 hypothetical protein F5891DRAFT_1191175 [Suillus fuscotomentosus]